MSSASVTSSKREKQNIELAQEIDSMKAMNSSLRAYLEHLRVLKKNLLAMNSAGFSTTSALGENFSAPPNCNSITYEKRQCVQ